MYLNFYKDFFYAAMVDLQLKKDTAKRFYCYPFCRIYTVYHNKIWNASEKVMN